MSIYKNVISHELETPNMIYLMNHIDNIKNLKYLYEYKYDLCDFYMILSEDFLKYNFIIMKNKTFTFLTN